MSDKILLIATRNKAKFQEIKKYLSDVPYKLVSLDDLDINFEVEETGTTYEENATLKAEAYAKLSGLLTLADDGGIEVEALGGKPGVRSARYAGPNSTGEEKIALLLDSLKEMPKEKRGAQFVVLLALVYPGNDIKLFREKITGHITREPRGKLIKGIPYRQVFILDGYDQTMSELDEQNVAYITHRKKALDKVKNYLKSI